MRKKKHPAREAIRSFLTFNYAERRGVIALVMLIFAIEGVNALLPSVIKMEDHDFSAFEEEIRALEARMSCPDTLRKAKPVGNPNSHTGTKPVYEKSLRPPRPPVRVNLNTADTSRLQLLHGIGPSFARRIVKYREMLGGYYDISQLLEVFGMDSARLEMFREQLVLSNDSIRKMAVNEAEFRELLRHPYLDYETVKDIVNYREYIGPISHPDTLRRIIGYEPMFEKVRHYVEYRPLNKE